MKTQPQLSGKFDNVDNFRDIQSSDNTGRLKEGMIFRSATLDDASERDAQTIAKYYNITTIIDLTGTDHNDVFKQMFKVCDINKLEIPQKIRKRCRHVVQVRLLGRRHGLHVWKQTPTKTKYKVLGMIFTFRKKQAKQVIAEEVEAPKGLLGMYKDIVDYGTSGMYKVLNVMTDPSVYPVLIHCMQGKDRTGVVIAIIERLLGFSLSAIGSDYSRTEQGLDFQKRIEHVRDEHLSEDFVHTPSRVIVELLEYIDTKYGSLPQYLDLIGFNYEAQRKLVECVTTEKDQIQLQSPAA